MSARKVHTREQLTALPVGSAIWPFGYEAIGKKPCVKRADGMFVSPAGVCFPVHIGLPATVVGEQ